MSKNLKYGCLLKGNFVRSVPLQMCMKFSATLCCSNVLTEVRTKKVKIFCSLGGKTIGRFY